MPKHKVSKKKTTKVVKKNASKKRTRKKKSKTSTAKPKRKSAKSKSSATTKKGGRKLHHISHGSVISRLSKLAQQKDLAAFRATFNSLVEEKLEKYFGYLARCEGNFCI